MSNYKPSSLSDLCDRFPMVPFVFLFTEHIWHLCTLPHNCKTHASNQFWCGRSMTKEAARHIAQHTLTRSFPCGYYANRTDELIWKQTPLLQTLTKYITFCLPLAEKQYPALFWNSHRPAVNSFQKLIDWRFFFSEMVLICWDYTLSKIGQRAA